MVHEHALPTNGVSLSVRTWDDTCSAAYRPVVLLAGTGATARDWDTIAVDLSRDRVVHAVDLRGHGASQWPGTYSIAAMAADIAGLLPQLGSDLDVIGHSLGGLVACRAATVPGTPIRRMVLEDVGLLHPRPPATPARPDEPLDVDWAVVEQVRPEIDTPDPGWAQVLRAITVPTLAISGGPASFVPPEHVRELTDLVVHGTFVTIDAGHLIHATRPEEFLTTVHGYLDARPAPGSLSS